MDDRIYVCIDLKSFYASVECRERNLDPMTTNLVVADVSRTTKTICLAVSPSLKALGLSGRARLFQVVQKVQQVNLERRRLAPGRTFTGQSFDGEELAAHPELELTYLAAPPRMAHYMEYSTRIYQVYLKYVAPEDIHVYSIDEVFMDVTGYLAASGMDVHGFTRMLIDDVMKTTGITATAGIGTNLYLAKIAMDIVAKHIPADRDGVRIAWLDEQRYRELLWEHRPLTDFWRVGRGYQRKLEAHGMYTMGDVARCSVSDNPYCNEELLYQLFGVNAELLIDHAWGWEPCTLAEIKAYRPESSSLGTGQILTSGYSREKAGLVVREMTDSLVLDLVDKGLVTDQLVLTVGYDADNLIKGGSYRGPVVKDSYGRTVPKPAHGTANLERPMSSARHITAAVTELYDRIVLPGLLVRKLTLTANHVVPESAVPAEPQAEQLDLFTDYARLDRQREQERETLEKEKKKQQAVLSIRKKFGKNAILKGMDLEEGATAILRNGQIGGHKA